MARIRFFFSLTRLATIKENINMMNKGMTLNVTLLSLMNISFTATDSNILLKFTFGIDLDLVLDSKP